MARYQNTSILTKAEIKRLKKNGEEIPFKLCAITAQQKVRGKLVGDKTVFDRECLLDQLDKKGITKEIQGMGSQVVDAEEWLHKISRNSGKESNYMNLLFFQTWFDGRLHARLSTSYWRRKLLRFLRRPMSMEARSSERERLLRSTKPVSFQEASEFIRAGKAMPSDPSGKLSSITILAM